ncbi:MAG: hypothetical protein CVV50_05295 [Spirochaetae bacterium HGW-Spirochaetae-6]|nr:MAG: hypothetical protein CVV50_05295 [Spirochaetae bacterium HGW-Spirochaetae-6]
MSSMQEVTVMVQKLMQEKGVTEESAKVAPGHWVFINGSFRFEIRLQTFKQLGEIREGIAIAGYLMPLPADPVKLAELQSELLSINSQIVGAWFGIHQNQVLLVSSRELENLDYSELLMMADNISRLGDSFDDMIKEKYSN